MHPEGLRIRKIKNPDPDPRRSLEVHLRVKRLRIPYQWEKIMTIFYKKKTRSGSRLKFNKKPGSSMNPDSENFSKSYLITEGQSIKIILPKPYLFYNF
jgi:hypothetical protein